MVNYRMTMDKTICEKELIKSLKYLLYLLYIIKQELRKLNRKLKIGHKNRDFGFLPLNPYQVDFKKYCISPEKIYTCEKK